MKLTVHSVVRNEPFIWYSIKSVYDHVDLIFLYDTGSYDAHTLEDIETLLSQDVDKKIVFKKVPIDVDETQWNMSNIQQKRKEFKGKKVVGHVRLQQMEETKTPFFMVLDGDEVYYRKTMEVIQKVVRAWPAEKICGFVPSLWFHRDMNHILEFKGPPSSGRIFLTEGVGMYVMPLGEMATNKRTRVSISSNDKTSFDIPGVLPFAHFESFLKPWRRRETASHIKRIVDYSGLPPEVMQENDYYLKRFLSERGGGL